MADRQKLTIVPFKKGDKVWLDSRNLKMTYHKKMKPKQEGPFTITEVLGPWHRLQLPSSWRIHNLFHAVLLRPYQENEVYGMNFTKSPPKSVEGDKVYEVEAILKHRKKGCGYQYYVKWKGYPISNASWECHVTFHHASLPSFAILTNPDHSRFCLLTPDPGLNICGLRWIFC